MAGLQVHGILWFSFFSTSFCLPKLRIPKSLREIRARGRYFFLKCKEFNQHLNSARDAIPPVAISKITHRRPHSSTCTAPSSPRPARTTPTYADDIPTQHAIAKEAPNPTMLFGSTIKAMIPSPDSPRKRLSEKAMGCGDHIKRVHRASAVSVVWQVRWEKRGGGGGEKDGEGGGINTVELVHAPTRTTIVPIRCSRLL